MIEEKETRRDLPTTAQFEAELKRLRYRQNFIKTLWSTVSSLIVVAAVAVIISTMLLPVLRVTGTSMTPTLQNDEILICNKLGDIKQGDIIAFYYNNNILVKRVIAHAGEWVDISEDGTVYVNNVAVDEPYLTEKAFGECNIQVAYQVPDSRFFVMGDHRSVSIDSRNTAVGCIAAEQIVGKIVFRVWPLRLLGRIS